MGLTREIKQKAHALGFDLVGFADVSPIPTDHVNRFLKWLHTGYAGRMTWLHNNLDERINPAKLLPGAKSIIVVGLHYKPQPLLPRATKSPPMGCVVSYARYEDYHLFITRQLRKLVGFLVETIGHGLKFRICVDSAPLFERALAVRAGLGFIGKNRMLTNPRLGPQILLGEIITNLELEPDEPITGECLDCGRCLAACPTGAIRPDDWFDATKCISYLTIESKSKIPPKLAPKIGNHLFGCSECLLACPYQEKAPFCTNEQFTFYPDRAELDLGEVLNLSEEQFHSRFTDSPLLRAGLSHLKHVAQVCLKNTAVQA